MSYGMAIVADLAETVKAVEALDRRIIATKADVRDAAALKKAVGDGVAALGELDVVVANAGICTIRPLGRGHAAGLAGHPGHEPDRRVEHDGRWHAAPDREWWRVDHLHQLHRGHQGLSVPGPRTCRGKSRSGTL